MPQRPVGPCVDCGATCRGLRCHPCYIKTRHPNDPDFRSTNTRRVDPTVSWRTKYVVDAETGCWVWQSWTDSNGYGKQYMGLGLPARPAHRYVFEQLVGPIPPGLHIDHLCRNRLCVNPDHLEPVTQRENTARGMSPVAIASRTNTCLEGHPLTGDNVSVRKKAGARRCRTCKNRKARERYASKRDSA